MNLIEISNRFPDELSCIEYAEGIRYGKKPKCAYCGSTLLSKRRPDYRHKCLTCNKSTSVTVNTNIHNTRLPLKTWFYAVSVITDAKKGMSALQLQRNINISYPTAFSMYHKLRELMMEENKGIDELEGVVEMDETYIGGKPRKFNNPNFKPNEREELNRIIEKYKKEGFDFTPKKSSRAKSKSDSKRGRGTDNIPVVGIVERDGNVVAEVMKNTTYANLKNMVQKHVKEKDSVLITDNYKGYNSMKKIIDHIIIDHKEMYSYKGLNSNSIESFWAIIDRGIMGQYHSVSPKKLPNYIAEFVYRYNNRKDTDLMFDDLLKKMLEVKNEIN